MTGSGGPAASPLGARIAGARHCPKCGSPTLIRIEGCDTCSNCGYSKCA